MNSWIYIFQILKLLAASSDESICQVKDLIGSIGHCYPDLHSLYFYPDSQYILPHTVSHTLIYMYYQWSYLHDRNIKKQISKQ